MIIYICVDASGAMQGVDSPSGGYPFCTDNLNNVRFWYSKDKAVDYAKMFDLEVKEFSFTLSLPTKV